MARILVDTSAVFALLDRSDDYHASAKSTLDSLRRRRVEPFLTNFVVAETHALALSCLGVAIARRWLLRNVWSVERVQLARL